MTLSVWIGTFAVFAALGLRRDRRHLPRPVRR